jgi:hypothetical protein
LRCGIKRPLMGAAGASGGWLSAAGLPDAKAAAGCAQSKGLVVGAVGVLNGVKMPGIFARWNGRNMVVPGERVILLSVCLIQFPPNPP